MMQLLLNNDLRLSELLYLKWRNVDLMTGQLTVIESKDNLKSGE